jgi:hypothetical protein
MRRVTDATGCRCSGAVPQLPTTPFLSPHSCRERNAENEGSPTIPLFVFSSSPWHTSSPRHPQITIPLSREFLANQFLPSLTLLPRLRTRIHANGGRSSLSVRPSSYTGDLSRRLVAAGVGLAGVWWHEGGRGFARSGHYASMPHATPFPSYPPTLSGRVPIRPWALLCAYRR